MTKTPGGLGFAGEYTTQLCGGFIINHCSDLYTTTRIQWKARPFFFFFVAHLGLSGHIDFHRIKQLLQFPRVQLRLEDLRKKKVSNSEVSRYLKKGVRTGILVD